MRCAVFAWHARIVAGCIQVLVRGADIRAYEDAKGCYKWSIPSFPLAMASGDEHGATTVTNRNRLTACVPWLRQLRDLPQQIHRCGQFATLQDDLGSLHDRPYLSPAQLQPSHSIRRRPLLCRGRPMVALAYSIDMPICYIFNIRSRLRRYAEECAGDNDRTAHWQTTYPLLGSSAILRSLLFSFGRLPCTTAIRPNSRSVSHTDFCRRFFIKFILVLY